MYNYSDVLMNEKKILALIKHLNKKEIIARELKSGIIRLWFKSVHDVTNKFCKDNGIYIIPYKTRRWPVSPTFEKEVRAFMEKTSVFIDNQGIFNDAVFEFMKEQRVVNKEQRGVNKEQREVNKKQIKFNNAIIKHTKFKINDKQE
ncbi:hypothetical protein [Candidatus Mycoplasma mahonii]|uniref:hypothetical protein n=1 Tax=Candidatus Mycoplasma mahonii TaxID=3004105 RepID=UPI0026EB9E65|nr:hypothetical protein [Candidatus Mycoplasma mahonii]WKX02393.1 hypothetical protein O3I44_03300 [Candidatus Mycoplasma mahonii]